jgi:hypothetical protein
MHTRRLPWSRRALGLFAAVWLNLAWQPCAMALDSQSGHGCPHCPPAYDQSAPSHHGHDVGPGSATHCDSLQASCADGHEIGFESRAGKHPGAGNPGDVPVAIVSDIPEPQISAATNTACPARPPDRPHVAPSLNVLYCVYLK